MNEKKNGRESLVCCARRPITRDTFCPNSARTYFHAARVSHGLSRDRTDSTVTNDGPTRAGFLIFAHKSVEKYTRADEHNQKRLSARRKSDLNIDK